MNRRHLFALAAGLSLAAAVPAVAQSAKAGAISIQRPWVRPTPPGAPTGGGYVTLVNSGSQPDRLLGGSTPVAARLEVHEMSMDGSIMRMRKLENGLALAPGKTVELKPGGLHLMLIGLKRPLKPGERVPVTLKFERAGEVAVTFMVQTPPAAGQPPMHGNR